MCLVAFAIGLAPVAGSQPPRSGPRSLTMEVASIRWITSGRFIMGASETDVQRAVELCAAQRPLPIRSLAPSTDGACTQRRFLPELPWRWRWTDAYGIDRTEVTIAAYDRCVAVGRCRPSFDPRPSRPPSFPIVAITHPQAREFCRFAGGRLPTEAEWERAARGPTGRPFPWGHLYNSRLANHGRSPEGPDESDGFAGAAPVGSFPGGVSPFGLYDMAGNVWEWTESSPRPDDVGAGADPAVYRVIRGGSHFQPAETLRVTHRVWVAESEHRGDLGFRCAYDSPGNRP